MFCKNCGTELAEGAKFCKNCGAKIEIEPVIIQDEKSVGETTAKPAGGTEKKPEKISVTQKPEEVKLEKESERQPVDRGGNNKTILIVAIAAVLLIAVIIIAVISSKKDKDESDQTAGVSVSENTEESVSSGDAEDGSESESETSDGAEDSEVTGAIEYTMEKKELADNVYFQYPKLKGNTDEINKINILIENEADQFLKEETIDNPDHEWHADAEVTCNDGTIFSVRFDTMWYGGGIVSSGIRGQTYSVKTGEKLIYEDILPSEYNTYKLEDHLYSKLEERYEISVADKFYEDYILTKDQGFYVDDGNIVFLLGVTDLNLSGYGGTEVLDIDTGIVYELMDGEKDSSENDSETSDERVKRLISEGVDRKLTEKDLKKCTPFELAAIRNGMYAEYNYAFNDSRWRDYYTDLWGGYYQDPLFDSSSMSKLEEKNSVAAENTRIIADYEKDKNGRQWTWDDQFD